MAIFSLIAIFRFFEAADSVLVNRDDREGLRLRDAVEESLDVASTFASSALPARRPWIVLNVSKLINGS